MGSHRDFMVEWLLLAGGGLIWLHMDGSGPTIDGNWYNTT